MGRVGVGVALGCAVVTCAIAAVLVERRARSRRKWQRAVELVREFEEGCQTSVARLRQVVDAMAVEMHAGLASDGGSKLKMLLSYIDKLPDGTEEGTFYALHLGGTYFRVLRVQLGGEGSNILSRQFEREPIPQELMTSTSQNLFDYIASTLNHFIEREDGQTSDDKRELGFTFSFPVRQISVSSGALIKWTKGFSIKDAVGKDVSQCLEEALTKRGLNMRVAALIFKALKDYEMDGHLAIKVNDTVGTLALCHFYDKDTVAAVVIGTGTNACYVERSDAIIKCQGFLKNSGGMVVNMEWGNFWSSHLPRTSYDIALDEESPNRNDQGFEKMISGMYLGEIARRVIYRMAQELDIFGDAAHSLSVPFSLRTPLMADMHEDASPDLREVKRILEDNLQMSNVPIKTRRLVVRICDIVTRRAARLAAAGIVGILKKIGRDGTGGIASGKTKGKPRRSVVAIEGGLYAGYSIFREYLNESVMEILGEEVAPNVVIRAIDDGSGTGAALLAAANSLYR